VVSKFYEGCYEADLDGISQNGNLLMYGIADHVELAGTHSGDAHMVMPPYRLTAVAKERLLECGRKLAKALEISGPFNSQFIITPDDDVLVIECNVRASRSLPFMSKTLRRDMIGTMSRVLMGHDMSHVKPEDDSHIDYVGVKVPQFSWTRLKGADPRCGVEMASTGETATYGPTVNEAFLKSVNSVHVRLPKKPVLLSALQDSHVTDLTEVGELMTSMQYKVHATEKVHNALKAKGIMTTLQTMEEGRTNLKARKYDHVFCIPSRQTADREIEAGVHYMLRRDCVEFSCPITTEPENAKMWARSLANVQEFTVTPYGDLPSRDGS